MISEIELFDYCRTVKDLLLKVVYSVIFFLNICVNLSNYK